METWREGERRRRTTREEKEMVTAEGPLAIDCSFYADDSKVGSHDAPSIQQSATIFADKFERIGLKANVRKTKAMVTIGRVDTIKQSSEAYSRRTTGVGRSHRQREAENIECPICGEEMQRKSLRNHMRFKHEEKIGEMGGEEKEEEAEGVFESYMRNTNKARGQCPVPGCGVHVTRRYGMRRHFMHRHPLAAVHFPDEGELEMCEECSMHVPDVRKYRGSQLCRRAKERERKRRQEEENRKAATTIFTINGRPVENVKEFKYLGRVLSDDDDWPAMRANIKKARKRWGQVAQILSREGAATGTMAYFYKAVVQAVLLYGAESWVITDRMWRAINSFHNRCTRYISGEHIRQKPNGEWDQPATKRVLEQCRLLTVEEYIAKRKETVKTFVENRPVYKACVESIPTASNANQKVWWDN